MGDENRFENRNSFKLLCPHDGLQSTMTGHKLPLDLGRFQYAGVMTENPRVVSDELFRNAPDIAGWCRLNSGCTRDTGRRKKGIIRPQPVRATEQSVPFDAESGHEQTQTLLCRGMVGWSRRNRHRGTAHRNIVAMIHVWQSAILHAARLAHRVRDG